MQLCGWFVASAWPGRDARSMLVWIVRVAYEPKTIPSDAPTTISLYDGFFLRIWRCGRKQYPAFLTEG